MKIIVCGGRNYSDMNFLYSSLDKLKEKHGIELIVNGGADGADKLARNYAKSRRIELRTCEADWKKHGKAAGPIRNRQMAKYFGVDAVVAFSGGEGTENMISTAKSFGIKVWDLRK